MKQVTEDIGEIDTIELESLDELIAKLQELKAKGATHFFISKSDFEDPGEPEEGIKAYKYRDETPEEIAKREQREKEYEQRKKNPPMFYYMPRIISPLDK